MKIRALKKILPAPILAVALAWLGSVRPPLAAPRTAASAEELVLTVDPAQSQVHWTLDTTLHTVHGTFRLKSGELRFDPATGKAAGEIIADATSGASGNDSRDKKMHQEVLESPKFTEVIFRPERVEGQVAKSGDSNVQLHGILTLHGGDHQLNVPVTANLDGTRWRGSAKFSVPFIDWGLKNPSTFLLKVKHEVNLSLDLSGSVQSGSP